MSDEQRWYTEPGGHWTRVKFVGQQPLGVICETTKEWAEQIVRDHNAALEAADRQAALAAELRRVKAALEAMTESSDRLLRERDQYMNQLGLLLPYLDEAQMAIVRSDSLALNTAPAVAPGASDAGEGSDDDPSEKLP